MSDLPLVQGAIPFQMLPLGVKFTCLPTFPNEWYEKVDGGAVRTNLDGTPHPSGKDSEGVKMYGPSPVEPDALCFLRVEDYPIPVAVHQYHACLEVVAKHFDLDSVWYELVPHLDEPWMGDEYGTVGYWPEGTPPEQIEPGEPEYAAELYGKARWETEEYTLFHVYNNGMKEAWLFDNTLKVEQE